MNLDNLNVGEIITINYLSGPYEITHIDNGHFSVKSLGYEDQSEYWFSTDCIKARLIDIIPALIII